MLTLALNVTAERGPVGSSGPIDIQLLLRFKFLGVSYFSRNTQSRLVLQYS
jgi:hypothetical protein